MYSIDRPFYCPGKEKYCADTLSHFPLPLNIPEALLSGDIIDLMAYVIHHEVPVTAKQIACAKNSNPNLSQIKCCIISGNWSSLLEGAKSYLMGGLSIDADCLL